MVASVNTSACCVSQMTYRIREWLRLEGSLKITELQPPAVGRDVAGLNSAPWTSSASATVVAATEGGAREDFCDMCFFLVGSVQKYSKDFIWDMEQLRGINDSMVTWTQVYLDLLGPESHSWFMVLHNYDNKVIPINAEDGYKYPDLNCLFIKVLILSLRYKVWYCISVIEGIHSNPPI